MTGEQARTQGVRQPGGRLSRRDIVQVATAGVVLLLVCVWCNPPAWPTLVWRHVGRDCGTVRHGGPVISSGATRAETCFATAYHHCSAATLSASDLGASYSFVIEPYGFTCAIGVIWSSLAGPEIGYCGSMRLEASGLRVLNCQRVGDVFVPGGP